ncbi:MAG: rod shape-determining protein RodA [Proteobacteria bacterium]|nr:rod shape-determining protein RodA [Pseudomonadota bacterium]
MRLLDPNTIYEKLTKYDFNVMFISIIITIIGLFNIYSATNTASITGTAGLFAHQLIFIGIGLVLMTFFIIVDYRRFEKTIYIAYAINLILLIAVLLVGRSASGAKRWLSLGPISLQPSEFMKITVVLTLARYFSNDINFEGYTLRDLLVPTMIVGIPAGLIIIEPDLGSGLLLLLVAFSIFLFVKVNWRSLLIVAMVGSISLPIVYNFVLKDYQRKRVMTFLDPTLDPKGAGYNSLQSRIAVGSGQLIGKGHMKGTQTQLNFLPEHHTDFIYSVLAEEHGFLGSVFLVILYVLLFMAGIRVGSQAGDRLGVLIVMGCTAVIFWHAFVNIGMVIGIMPVVGVTLPFMSYGGTSIIVNFILIGLIQGIAVRRFMF